MPITRRASALIKKLFKSPASQLGWSPNSQQPTVKSQSQANPIQQWQMMMRRPVVSG